MYFALDVMFVFGLLSIILLIVIEKNIMHLVQLGGFKLSSTTLATINVIITPWIPMILWVIFIEMQR